MLKGLVAGLFSLIAAIAGAVTIFGFSTGYDSLPDFLRNLGRNPVFPQSSPLHINARIADASLDRFQIIGLPVGVKSARQFFAIEKTAWFTRPRHLVQLYCNAADSCSGLRLVPLGKLNLKDPFTVKLDRERLVIIDNRGAGVSYNGVNNHYSGFNIIFPCLTVSGYRSVDFSNGSLGVEAHAISCKGQVQIGAFAVPIAPPQRMPRWNESAYYSLKIGVVFDQFGGIADLEAKVLRVKIATTTPHWLYSGFSPRPEDLQKGNGSPAKDVRRHSIVSALTQYAQGRIHLADRSSDTTISNALSACDIERDALVAFVDVSFDRNGYIGVCFLETGIVSRPALSEPRFVTYDAIVAKPPWISGKVLWLHESGEDVGIPYFGLGPNLVSHLLSAAAKAATNYNVVSVGVGPP